MFTGCEFTVNAYKCSTFCALTDNVAKGNQYPLTTASSQMLHLQTVGQGYGDGYSLEAMQQVTMHI